MILRPVDENGDVLPVLVSASLLKGTGAVARLVKDRLELLAGDWWENPAWGNAIVDIARYHSVQGIRTGIVEFRHYGIRLGRRLSIVLLPQTLEEVLRFHLCFLLSL